MKFTISASILAALAAMPAVQAHMVMTDPAPIHHQSNPNSITVNSDYSSPMMSSAQYPCKGVLAKAQPGELKPVATWAAGSKQSFTVSGGAAHNGGSCQAAISEDNGKSFKVVKSYIGGCPVSGGKKFDFTLPKETKNGDVLFAWTWFNKVGVREMYMNCASISVTGGGSGLSAYPDVVVANSASDGKCKYPEGSDPLFPNPGKDVETAPDAKPVAGVGECGAAGPAAPQTPSKPDTTGTPATPSTGSTPSGVSTPASSPTAKPAGGNQWYDPSTNPGIPKNNKRAVRWSA